MNLTKARLDAIIEALLFRTAGELGDDACPAKDYEAALDWAFRVQGKRNRAKAAKADGARRGTP